MSRILVVEDEQHIADGLRFNLEAEGHDAVGRRQRRAGAEPRSSTSARAVRRRRARRHACREGRLRGRRGSAHGRTVRADPDADRAQPARGRAPGIRSRAPTTTCRSRSSSSILIARVNGLLRRRRWSEAQSQERAAPPAIADVYTFAGRTLDFTAMEMQARGKSFQLTLMECDLLRYLVTHAGQPVSRRAILENVWGLHESTDTRAIDNFIVRLRTLPRGSPRLAAVSADRPRRRLQVRARRKVEVRIR